jgi:hypothetical protein
VCEGFLHDAPGTAEGLFRGDLVRHEGKVGNDHGAMHHTGDGLGVVNHLVEGDGQCRGVSLEDIADGIADQDEVDTRFVEQTGGQKIIRRQAGDRLPCFLHFKKGSRGDTLA